MSYSVRVAYGRDGVDHGGQPLIRSVERPTWVGELTMRTVIFDDQRPAGLAPLAHRLASRHGHDVILVGAGCDRRPLTLMEPASGTLAFESLRVPPPASPGTHRYLRRYEQSIMAGLGAHALVERMVADGRSPDVVIARAGSGRALYLKDVCPSARLVLTDVWYEWSRGSIHDFFDAGGPTVDQACAIHASNADRVMELGDADWLVASSRFQLDALPRALWSKASVISAGVDLDLFRSQRGPRPRSLAGCPLADDAVVMSCVVPSFEPAFGIEQVVRAAHVLTQRRPELHVFVVGEDVVGATPPPDGSRSWKRFLQSRLPLDAERVHFLEPLDDAARAELLAATDVFVCLTAPMPLPTSLLEAMASGCTVIASRTAPVTEVARDGVDAVLVDFADIEALCLRVETALEAPEVHGVMARAARRTVEARFARERELARTVQMLTDVVNGRAPHDVEGWALAGSDVDPRVERRVVAVPTGSHELDLPDEEDAAGSDLVDPLEHRDPLDETAGTDERDVA